MTKTRLPKFKSIKEEAEFWDSHDVTKYFDKKNPVTLDFSRVKVKKDSLLTVRLQPELKLKLFAIAQDMGTQPSTLARMWLVEKLKNLNIT